MVCIKKMKKAKKKNSFHLLNIKSIHIILCTLLQLVSKHKIWISSIQSLSRVQLFATPWTATHQASLSVINSWSPSRTHGHWVGDAIQPSHPLSSPSPPAFNLSQQQGLFQWVLHIRWPKYWSFSFSIRPSSEHPGLISFRMDWLDLPAVQGTLKSLLQDHSSKASILSRPAFLYSPTLTSIHDYWKNRRFD